jgi:hypothetical protein
MVFGAILERFVEKSPSCVMIRATMENVVTSELLDQVFAQTARRQYCRELLFSTVVDLLGLVATVASQTLIPLLLPLGILLLLPGYYYGHWKGEIPWVHKRVDVPFETERVMHAEEYLAAGKLATAVARVYTQVGMDWINDNDMSSVLLRHYPELTAPLRGVKNAFAPWPKVH